VRWAAP
jgi:hypothetical protein